MRPLAAPVTTLSLLAAAGFSAGCDDNGPEFRLEIAVDGWLERGAVVVPAVSFMGEPVAAEDVVWSAEPVEAVAFLADGRIRLIAAGTLTLSAEAAIDGRQERGRRALEIAAPPLVLFDLSVEGNRDIYSIALDGQDLTRLTTSAGDDVDPSAAAGIVAFTSFRDGNAEIYSVPLSGGAPTRLTQTQDDEIQPALSLDGTQLGFLTDATGVFRLWSMPLGGGAALPLTEGWGSGGSVEASPSWSPTGGAIVFISTTNGTADIFTVEPGVDPLPLVVSPDANVEPAWSPDGDRVVFASNRTGDTELFLISLTTEEIVRLTDRPGSDGEPVWLPDGRIVYTAWVENTPTLRWLDPASPVETFEIPMGAGSPRRPSGITE